MRVVELWARTKASPAGVLTRLDDFAALHGAPTADPAIGGFRIVRPRPAQRSRFGARGFRWIGETRLHTSGSLSVLLIGGLALAVLAGPASCPCDPAHGAAASVAAASDAQLLSRFAYTRASAIDLPSETQGDRALPQLAALEVPVGTSPISTSAITPARETFARPDHPGVLPTKIEALTDQAPKLIQLAAADPTDEMLVPTLPMVEVATPETPEAIPGERQTEPAVTEIEQRAEHVVSRRHHHALHARRANAKGPSASDIAKYKRVPRWAQQMFDTPWQSKAFSYIR